MSLCISSYFRCNLTSPISMWREVQPLRYNQARKPEGHYCCQNFDLPLSLRNHPGWSDLINCLMYECKKDVMRNWEKWQINMTRCRKSKSTEDVRRKDEMFISKKEKAQELNPEDRAEKIKSNSWQMCFLPGSVWTQKHFSRPCLKNSFYLKTRNG